MTDSQVFALMVVLSVWGFGIMVALGRIANFLSNIVEELRKRNDGR